MAFYYKLLLLFILLLTGCVAPLYKANYDLGLKNVERSSNANTRYGGKKIVDATDRNPKVFVFEDAAIKISWSFSIDSLNFTLNNKTDSSIQIIWDEAIYVDENGKSHQVMHNGVKFIDRNNTKPPSVVATKGSLDDLVSPVDKVYFVEYLDQTINNPMGWHQKPLFDVYQNLHPASDRNTFTTKAQSFIGKTVKVVLPIKIQGQTCEYTFVFNVKGVQVE